MSKANTPRILAMDVGRTMIKSALFINDGSYVEMRKTPSSGLFGDALVEGAVKAARMYENYDLIAIAISGQTDTGTGTILFDYRKDGEAKGREINRPVGANIKRALSKDTVVLNDSTAAALGEAKFGAGKGVDDFICITFGTGIGGGIIIGGKVYEGQRGIAGEFGHMVVHRGGRLCGCGNCGCYEQYASVTALVQQAKAVDTEIENAMDLIEKAQHDAGLKKVADEWADEVIAGLETLTYIWNPALIVLGGGIMESRWMLELIRGRFYNHVIPTFGQVELRAAECGNQAGLYGIYAYAKQKLNL